MQQQQKLGLWVIAGFFTFLTLEMMFLDRKEKEDSSQVSASAGTLLLVLCGNLRGVCPGLATTAHLLALFFHWWQDEDLLRLGVLYLSSSESLA